MTNEQWKVVQAQIKENCDSCVKDRLCGKVSCTRCVVECLEREGYLSFPKKKRSVELPLFGGEA